MGKKKRKEKASPGELQVCTNVKALQRFTVDERMEAGMVLQGSEVKSLRAKHANLDGAYAGVTAGELFLYKMQVAPYSHAVSFGHEPKRTRKLLVHKAELLRLTGKLAQRGYTLLPLRVYFRGGRAKVELGLCKVKDFEDRREDIKRRTDLREARGEMARARRR